MSENEKKGKFNQNEYVKNYKKQNYKSMAVQVKTEIFEKITQYCKNMGISRQDFLTKAALYIIDNDLLPEIKK